MTNRHVLEASLLVAFLVLLLTTGGTVATRAHADDYARDLPRVASVSAGDAPTTMHVAPGFSLELTAAEPLLASPVAIDWDEDGRLFVVEMRGYSEDRDRRLGRVRLLLDDDRDGRYDRACVFAEGLAWPTAICCWNGGVFVGDAPDLLYLRDTDGDGVADERRQMLTGFGTGNVQGLLNSLRYGIDNRIHGSASSNGGEVRRVIDGQPVGPAIQLRGRDFSFHPRSLDVRAETGGGQHGMAFDDHGHRYTCANSDHAIRCMINDCYLGRNPDFTPPPGRESIAIDGPQAAVFRVSPVEPWRVLRTRLRASGVVPGIVEGGGRPAGYFTSATGITVVRGDRVGELRGMLVVGDVGSNLVHRKRLLPHGSGARAERVDVASELIASEDIWFRPVQFANGPDGGLWIIDMQREVIEHPASLPPEIKRHLDLTSGRDAGRLWRLTVDEARSPPLPSPLGNTDATTLVRLLSHANAWHRETAQRLLVTRGGKEVAPLLRAVPDDPASTGLGRLHALWTLAGLAALSPLDVQRALTDDLAAVRAAGIRLAEPFLARRESGRLVEQLALLVAFDRDLEVRLQLACTAGLVTDDSRRRDIISTLLARDGEDPWCRIAACTSMRDDAASIAASWMASPERLGSAAAAAVMPALFAQVGRRGDPAAVHAAVAAIDALAVAPAAGERDSRPAATRLYAELEAALAAVGSSLRADGQSTTEADDLATRLAQFNSIVAHTVSRSAPERAAAIQGMAFTGIDVVVTFLDDPEPAVVRAVIDVLDRSADQKAAEQLIEALPRIPAALLPSAVRALTRTASRSLLLLTAVEDGRVAVDRLGQSAVDLLRRFPDKALQERATVVLGPPSPANRQPIVNAYQASMPSSPGNPTAGRLVFRAHCMTCHRVEGVGHELGPNLTALQARGPSVMLHGILDPNREVLPAYSAHTAVRLDGRVMTGLLVAESDTAVTLRSAEGMEYVMARDEIEVLIDTGRSLMPEGFERSIDPPAMVDLLAYLMSDH